MVQLSETMHELDQLAEQCAMVDGNGRFRGAEVRRLQRRLDQLAHELPLQTIPVETPVENHLAGFQVFVPNGYYDLSPQIFSWYGLPGVNVDEESTIFILGSNLRPHGLRVIVGNKELKPYYIEEEDTDEVVRNADNNAVLLNDEPILKKRSVTRTQVNVLSESVIELKIPAGVKTIKQRDFNGEVRDFVQVQVATHHGVSQSLLVPAWENESAAANNSDDDEEEEEETTAAANSSHATVQIQVGTQGDGNQTVNSGSRPSTTSSSSDSDDSDSEPSVTFDWEKVADEFNAVVTTTTGSEEIQSITFNADEDESELTLQVTLVGLPGKELFDSLVKDTPMLAFWVRQLTDGGTESVDPIAIGPFPIKIDAPLDDGAVEKALVTALGSNKDDGDNKLHDDTEYLELVGYVRFSDDSLPITKLGKSLKLKLERKTADAPASDTTPAATPDDASGAATAPESQSTPALPPTR